MLFFIYLSWRKEGEDTGKNPLSQNENQIWNPRIKWKIKKEKGEHSSFKRPYREVGGCWCYGRRECYLNLLFIQKLVHVMCKKYIDRSFFTTNRYTVFSHKISSVSFCEVLQVYVYQETHTCISYWCYFFYCFGFFRTTQENCVMIFNSSRVSMH